MDLTDNKQIMARNIKKYMERKGVSNQQLCDALDIKYTTFMDWIKGVTYPRIGKVELMANYFGCEKSDLIEDKREEPIHIGDELPDSVKKLADFAKTVPEDKAEMILRAMKVILGDD